MVTKRSGEDNFAGENKDSTTPLDDDPNIKTMYGTFNNARPSDVKIAPAASKAILDKLKSGGTTTDGPLDTASDVPTV